MAFRSHCVTIVDAAEEHDTSGDRFVSYVIECKFRNDQWRVKKRYSDFERFHRKLVAFYGKGTVPQLTGKRTLGQFSSEFISKRKRKLQSFLADTVDNIGSWKLKEAEKRLSGPGRDLGINPVLYIFLEFENNISKAPPQPATPAGGGSARPASMYVRNPEDLGSVRDPHRGTISGLSSPLTAPPGGAPDESGDTAPAPTGMTAEDFEVVLKRLDGDKEDEDRLATMDSILSDFRTNKKNFLLTCAQAKEIAARMYFGDSQTDMCKKILKSIVDPENRDFLFDVINFDEDEEELNALFDQGGRAA